MNYFNIKNFLYTLYGQSTIEDKAKSLLSWHFPVGLE